MRDKDPAPKAESFKMADYEQLRPPVDQEFAAAPSTAELKLMESTVRAVPLKKAAGAEGLTSDPMVEASIGPVGGPSPFRSYGHGAGGTSGPGRAAATPNSDFAKLLRRNDDIKTEQVQAQNRTDEIRADDIRADRTHAERVHRMEAAAAAEILALLRHLRAEEDRLRFAVNYVPPHPQPLVLSTTPKESRDDSIQAVSGASGAGAGSQQRDRQQQQRERQQEREDEKIAKALLGEEEAREGGKFAAGLHRRENLAREASGLLKKQLGALTPEEFVEQRGAKELEGQWKLAMGMSRINEAIGNNRQSARILGNF